MRPSWHRHFSGPHARLLFVLFCLLNLIPLVSKAYQQPLPIGSAASTEVNNSSFSSPRVLNANATGDKEDDTSIDIAADGLGVWIAVWSGIGSHPVSSAGDDIVDGKNQDIFFARSLDRGQTWSAPALLKTNAATDDVDDLEPDIETDGKGCWVVVWRSRDSLGGTIGNDTDLLVSHSSDNGATWSAPAALNSDAATDGSSGSGEKNDDHPVLAYDGAGHWLVSWSVIDNRSGAWRCSYRVANSSDGGAHWSDPYVLQDYKGYSGYPTCPASDGHGRWIVAWGIPNTSGVSTDWDIMFSISDDLGRTWSAPKPLNSNAGTDKGDDRAPWLATDGKGKWVAVWYSNDSLGGKIGTDLDILTACSVDNGTTWSAPKPLNTNAANDSGDDSWPRVVTDGQGRWITSWTSNDPLGGTVKANVNAFYSISWDGQSWSIPAMINTTATSDTSSDGAGYRGLALATDKKGRWLAAWASNNNLGGTIGDDFDILFATFDLVPPQSGSFTPPSVLNGNAATDTAYDDLVTVDSDGSGVWVAVWMHNGGALNGPGDSLATGPDHKKQDIFVARSTDNGVTWSAPNYLKANTGDGDDLEASLATDRRGHWVCIWRSRDSLNGTIGYDDDILVVCSNDNGETWSAPVALNINAASDPGGSDGGINGPLRVEATNAWPIVVTDGAGNWVATWYVLDNRIGAWISSFQTARSTDNGATWSAPATIFSYPDFGYPSGTVASGGPGRFVIVWHLPKNGGIYDLKFATSSDGGAHWSMPVALNASGATNSPDNNSPSLASDGMGHWVAAWTCAGGPYGNDKDIMVARSSDDGASWTPQALLNAGGASDTGDDLYPHVGCNRAGEWLVAWTSRDNMGALAKGTDPDVVYAISTDNGSSWSSPALVNTNGASDGQATDGPGPHSVAVGLDQGSGRWLVAWASTQDVSSFGANYDIHYAMRDSLEKNSITILSPRGGEQYAGDSLLGVHWRTNVARAGTAVRVELWNGQGRLAYLGDGWAASGETTTLLYLPLMPEDSVYRLKLVSLADPACAAFSQPFTITGGVIRLLQPNGGQTLAAGQKVPVGWQLNADLAGTAVGLELWWAGRKVADLGVDYDPDGEGQGEFVIPSTVPPGEGYVVRAVSLWHPTWYDESDGTLAVTNAAWPNPLQNAVAPATWSLFE